MHAYALDNPSVLLWSARVPILHNPPSYTVYYDAIVTETTLVITLASSEPPTYTDFLDVVVFELTFGALLWQKSYEVFDYSLCSYSCVTVVATASFAEVLLVKMAVGGGLYAIDLSSRTLLWTLSTIPTGIMPSTAFGTLVPSVGERIDIESGAVTTLNSTFGLEPVQLLDKSTNIYGYTVSSGDGFGAFASVFAFDSNAVQLWSTAYSLSTYQSVTALSMSSSGVLYFSSSTGIYAINTVPPAPPVPPNSPTLGYGATIGLGLGAGAAAALLVPPLKRALKRLFGAATRTPELAASGEYTLQLNA